MIYVEKLIQCLAELSSREFQARVWLATDGPEISSFEECVSQTFDDTGLSDAIASGQCPAELSARSYETLKDLDSAVSQVQKGLPPRALLDTPAMAEVRRKALYALKSLEQRFGRTNQE